MTGSMPELYKSDQVCSSLAYQLWHCLSVSHYCRSSQHLVNMVQKADLLLQAFEQRHPANTSLNTLPGGVNQPFPQASLLPSSTAQRE